MKKREKNLFTSMLYFDWLFILTLKADWSKKTTMFFFKSRGSALFPSPDHFAIPSEQADDVTARKISCCAVHFCAVHRSFQIETI